MTIILSINILVTKKLLAQNYVEHIKMFKKNIHSIKKGRLICKIEVYIPQDAT